MADTLKVAGLAPEAVYQTLVNKGLNKSEAAVFVGEWLLGEFAHVSRSFNYAQQFDSAKPNCAPKFVRGFIHQDWVDGEDTVQAGETAGEAGFNKRFHSIEKDLDALGQDTANLFACMAEMRRELANLLAEIRTEFNRLNRLVDQPQRGVITPAPGVLGTGTLLGSIKFNDKPMTLWNTPQGLMMLPAASVINPNPLDNPRATRPGQLAQFITDRPDVKQRFPQALTKQQFLDAFGREVLDDGTFVRDLLRLVPDNARFATVDAMLNDVVEREASALRTTEGIAADIQATLGIDTSKQSPSEASVDKFEAMPQGVRVALSRNGIDTVGKLAATDPARVQEILQRENTPNVTPGMVADWTTRAKTVTRLR